MRPAVHAHVSPARRVVLLAVATLAVATTAACAGASAAEDSARFAADTATIPGTVAPAEMAPVSPRDTGRVDSTAAGPRRDLVMLPAWAAEWQGDTAALHAMRPWLALVLDDAGARLAPVPVRRYAVESPCFSVDTAKVWTDRLEPAAAGVVFALWGESGLAAGSVVGGEVIDRRDFDAFSDPGDGGRLTPAGVRAVFRGDTLHFREEPVGDGFRVVVRWRGADEVLYETERQDEGSWHVRWIGDLDRDDVPDVLLDATWKYSVAISWLHLSGGTSHGARWRAVARYGHSAC